MHHYSYDTPPSNGVRLLLSGVIFILLIAMVAILAHA